MNKTTVPMIILLALGLALSSCESKKPDPSKYAELCTEVAKCDKNKTNPMLSPESCAKMLVGIEEKMGDKVSTITDCITNQSCEQKDMMSCMQSSAGMLLAP